MPSVPIGSIVAWNAPVSAIPRAWSLCDGSNGTPDLRGRIPVGAGGAYSPGNFGGDASHDHDFTGDGHAHQLGFGNDVNYAPFAVHNNLPAQSISGTTDIDSNMPPYYALPYIMYTGYH